MFKIKDLILGALYFALIALGILAISGFYRVHGNVLDIVEHPDPILRHAAEPVKHIDETLIGLADDMITTLRYLALVGFFSDRAVPRGLAAPQVGVSKRLVVLGLNGKLKVMVNPVIVEKKGIYEDRDGCLSVDPEEDIIIRRSAYVTVRYKDLENRPKVLVVKGHDAALVEHEIDHLNGVLNIDY